MKLINTAQISLLLIATFFETVCSSIARESSIVASFSEPLDVPAEQALHDSPVPLFYGWFFNESIGESISIIGKKYFIESYDTIVQFQIFINDSMSRNNISNPLEYYVKPFDPDTGLPDLRYHITAKFCGRNDSQTQCTTYLQEVGQYLGRPYQMHLVGLFFTKNTYGIRMKLTVEEQKLFKEDDRSNSAQAMVNNNETEMSNELHAFHSDAVMDAEVIAYEPYYNGLRDTKGSNRHPQYPGIMFRDQPRNFHPTESRAHITLGCATGIPAVQTGLDLLEVIDLEVSSFAQHQDFKIGGETIPTATLREYKVEDDIGSTAFVIYPTQEMIAEATFDAYL